MKDWTKWQRNSVPEDYYPCVIWAQGIEESEEEIKGQRYFLGCYDTKEKEWTFVGEYGLVLEPSGSEKIMLFPSLKIIGWKRIYFPWE